MKIKALIKLVKTPRQHKRMIVLISISNFVVWCILTLSVFLLNSRTLYPLGIILLLIGLCLLGLLSYVVYWTIKNNKDILWSPKDYQQLPSVIDEYVKQEIPTLVVEDILVPKSVINPELERSLPFNTNPNKYVNFLEKTLSKKLNYDSCAFSGLYNQKSLLVLNATHRPDNTPMITTNRDFEQYNSPRSLLSDLKHIRIINPNKSQVYDYWDDQVVIDKITLKLQ